MKDHTDQVRRVYDDRAADGPYATLAPRNRGGRKSRYVAEVFDATLIPRLTSISANRRLLDFGCGTGVFTLKADPYCDLIVGVDISPGVLSAARRLAQKKRQSIPLVLMDGFHLPFKAGEFDHLVARETLCHVTDDDLPRVLKELTRVLSKGAKFYLLDQVSESTKWQHHPGAPFVTKRSVRAIRRLFSDAGYEELEAVPVRRPRFPWIYLVQSGLIPEGLLSYLARWEVRFNRRFGSIETSRWQDVLFVFEKR